MRPEEVAGSIGRGGKVLQPGGFRYSYGIVVEVHSSGKFVRFERNARRSAWVPIEVVELHPETKTAPLEAPSSSRL